MMPVPMRILIAGATGVLGRRVVKLLVGAGHRVVGLSRSERNRETLASLGAEGRDADLFDAAQVERAAEGCDAVLHLATAIPTKERPAAADWAANDRIRREGTRLLVRAALRTKALLYVQQSVTFLYGDRGGAWVDEETPIAARQLSMIQSAADMEAIVRAAAAAERLPACILRFGSFYSHDAALTSGMLSAVSSGTLPVIGDGAAYWNLVHVDDAASAVARLVERHAEPRAPLYNVCDDEPVAIGALVRFLAAECGARPPKRVPAFLARMAASADTVRFFQSSVRCRNERFRNDFRWRPKYPTYREGFREVVKEWKRGGVNREL
jgi:nucleoside-diphosphate-sugar epimerase